MANWIGRLSPKEVRKVGGSSPPGGTLKPIYWLLMSSVFFAIGEVVSKKYAMNPTRWLAFWATVSYIPGIVLWLPAIKETKTLATTGAIWAVLGLIVTVVLGTVAFGEHVKPIHWLGFFCGATAVYTLSL